MNVPNKKPPKAIEAPARIPFNTANKYFISMIINTYLYNIYKLLVFNVLYEKILLT